MKIKSTVISWYNSGTVHKALTFTVYLGAMAIAAFIMELLYGILAFGNLNAILKKHLESSPAIVLVEQEIWQQQQGMGFYIFIYFCIILFATIGVVRKFAHLNIIGIVTLDKAVRFTEAMESLGLLHGAEQALFLQSNKLPLYIAEQPLTSSEMENVKARPYVFAHNRLSSQEYLDRQSGKRLLCVDVDELQAAIDTLYASLKLDNEPDDAKTVKSLQKRVLEMEQQQRAANRLFLENSNEINELKAENKKLASTNKGEELREGKKKKSEQELALYAMIFAPAYRRLSEGRHDAKDFTRAAFEMFFANELQASGKLHTQLKRITKRENFNRLPSNVFDAIWNNLKDFDLVNAGGAAPSGSLERLERLFYPGNR